MVESKESQANEGVSTEEDVRTSAHLEAIRSTEPQPQDQQPYGREPLRGWLLHEVRKLRQYNDAVRMAEHRWRSASEAEALLSPVDIRIPEHARAEQVRWDAQVQCRDLVRLRDSHLSMVGALSVAYQALWPGEPSFDDCWQEGRPSANLDAFCVWVQLTEECSPGVAHCSDVPDQEEDYPVLWHLIIPRPPWWVNGRPPDPDDY